MRRCQGSLVFLLFFLRNNAKQFEATPNNAQATPSNAKQCEAMRSAMPSNAKQCQAMPSNAKQCQAMPTDAKQCVFLLTCLLRKLSSNWGRAGFIVSFVFSRALDLACAYFASDLACDNFDRLRRLLSFRCRAFASGRSFFPLLFFRLLFPLSFFRPPH